LQRDQDLSAEDVFKQFDIDFDGKVSKEDFTKALTSFVKIPADSISPIQIDRLFSLLTNSDYLSLSDFSNLLKTEDAEWKNAAKK